MTVDFAEGKGRYFKNGTLKYNVEKKKYILALSELGQERAESSRGELAKGGGLKLDGKDAKTGDVSRLTMNTLAEGIRFQLKYEKQDGGRGLFSSIYAHERQQGRRVDCRHEEEARVHRLRRRGQHRRELPGQDILRAAAPAAATSSTPTRRSTSRPRRSDAAASNGD